MASASNNSDFEYQFLQDLAQHGSAANNNHNNRNNNDSSSNDIDLDTAVLLQSLADFEHPIPQSLVLAENLATSSPHAPLADDGGVAPRNRKLNPFKNAATPSPSSPLEKTYKPSKQKRQVLFESDDEPDVGFVHTSKTKKPKKLRGAADEKGGWGKTLDPGFDEDGYANGVKASNRKDARAAGVQSAAALFRQPSAASKKYTRAPMAIVYNQLEVSHKRFYELQHAAKAYMLDPKHPDRAACVGQRSKGDTDLTKFKLFGCVTSFLEDLGWGEKCWGKAEPTPPTVDGSRADKSRKLQWPESKEEIVTMVVPLFRRMVTNERQRIYALESRRKNSATRKLGGSKKESPPPTEEGAPQPNGERNSAPSPSPYLAIDPELKEYHNVNESPSAQQAPVSETLASSIDIANGEPVRADGGKLTYFVNFMLNGRRVMPKVTFPSGTSPDYSTLIQQIDGAIDDDSLKFTVKVLGPGTWLHVTTDDEWKRAIIVVRESEILDDEVKCVVQIEEA